MKTNNKAKISDVPRLILSLKKDRRDGQQQSRKRSTSREKELKYKAKTNNKAKISDVPRLILSLKKDRRGGQQQSRKRSTSREKELKYKENSKKGNRKTTS